MGLFGPQGKHKLCDFWEQKRERVDRSESFRELVADPGEGVEFGFILGGFGS